MHDSLRLTTRITFMHRVIGGGMDYRIYLLDEAGHIQAAEAFSAKDDITATNVSQDVFEACSDVTEGYEVWRGAERIRQIIDLVRARRLRYDAKKIRELREEGAIEVEERLQRTFAIIRRSERLLEVLKEREVRGGKLDGGDDYRV
jgi:hypothetical protein